MEKNDALKMAVLGIFFVILIGAIAILMRFPGHQLQTVLFWIISGTFAIAIVFSYLFSITRRHSFVAALIVAFFVAFAHVLTILFEMPFALSIHADVLGLAFFGMPWTRFIFIVTVCLAAIIISEPPLSDRHLGTGALVDWTFDAAVFVALIDVVLEPVLVSVRLNTFLPSAWMFLGVPYQQALGMFIVACLSCGVVIFTIRMSQFTRSSYTIVSAFLSAILIALGIAAFSEGIPLVWIIAFLTSGYMIVQSILRFSKRTIVQR